MRTSINCPQCSTPAQADVYQVIDVDSQPQFKQMLMAGALNIAQCQNCGWSGQVAMPLVYHESAHDMLLTFVPMELNMPYAEQEKMMGNLVRGVVDMVPQEKRRAYLLQPQQIMRWQTFMETVLATEGITPEMIAAQRKQSELMRTLMQTPPAGIVPLLKENAELIDDSFVGMVQSTLQQAVQAGREPESIALTNANCYLLTQTEVGRTVERRQLALQALGVEAKEAGGVSPELLVKHVLLNQEDDVAVDGLVAATGALSYEFFSAFSAEIESAKKADDTATAERLTAIRTRLLAVYDEMRAASEKAMLERKELVNAVLAADDKRAVLAQNSNKLDDLFISALELELKQARADANLERSVAIQEVQKILDEAMQQEVPPQFELITQMIQAKSPEEVLGLMDSNPDMVGPELVEILQQLTTEMGNTGQAEVKQRLEQITTLVLSKMAV